MRKQETEKEKKIGHQRLRAIKTAHVANWPCIDIGNFWASADEVRVADATALAGFTRVEFDLWLWGMTGLLTALKSADTTLNPGL